jgi:hypothetical protein
MDRIDPQHQKHDPRTSSGYTPEEVAAAAALRADATNRIADIGRRTEHATTPEEHTALGRERASAFGDYKTAGFVLSEGAGA